MPDNLLSNKFWQNKSLSEMNEAEWEALCDCCGKCCLHKLLDEEQEPAAGEHAGMFMHADEQIYYTDIRCRYLDPQTARCGCYAERLEKVAQCVNITLADLPQIHFMPSTCAYRRLHEGLGLADWHPLLHAGSKLPMQQAGIGVPSHVTISEDQISEDDYQLRIVTWPL